MQENRLRRVFAFLFIFLEFILSARSPAKGLPAPETASGVYVHAAYEYYRWEEGLRVMIWHDGVDHVSCSSFTNGQYEIECTGESIDNHTFTWRIVHSTWAKAVCS